MNRVFVVNLFLLVAILVSLLVVQSMVGGLIALSVTSEGEPAKLKTELFKLTVTSATRNAEIINYPVYVLLGAMLVNGVMWWRRKR